MKKLTVKQGIFSAIAGLISGAATGILPLVLMIFPALLGYIGAAWGYGALGIASAAACGVIFAHTAALGAASCAGYAAMLISQSFIIACIFKTKGAYRSAVAYCAIAAGLSQYGASCLMPLIELGDPFAHHTEFAMYFSQALVQSAAELGIDQLGMEQIEYLAAVLKASAPDIAVLSIVASSMLAGLLNVVIAKSLCKKFGVSTKKMAPFRSWQLSRSFYKGAMVLVLGTLLISFSDINNASAIIMALGCIIAGPYFLMGLCFLVFSIKQRRRGRAFLVITTIFLLLMLPYSIYGLCMMGVADRLFGIRRTADAG
ncbi:MAG: DUF2232 domain-containing protein [Clostridia bacterium]|nr:DUF2232 domain-containing protein [Clostridia bacterium]